MLKHLDITALIMLLISLCSCEKDKDPVATGDGMVNMVISVKTIDSQLSALTRANETYFEDPTSRFERIHTLRYIIVRPDGKVEHNYIIDSESETDYVNYVSFKVQGGEKKQIYLIANEASVTGYDFTKFVAGSSFDATGVEAITLQTQPGKPLFDNSAEGNQSYLPMAEHFEIEVKMPSPGTDGPTYQYETLFITRTTVKFSFSAVVSPVSTSDITLKKIVFNQIGECQYLFPRNTVYDPAKYPADASDRMITAYEVPQGAVTADVPFEINWEFPPMNGQGKTGSPALYFPETMFDGNYTATIVVNVDGDDFTYTAQLPNLPSLPRNTHVKIDMVLTGHDVTCIVDVAQYIGVILKPQFGFEVLHPNQQP